MTPTLRQPSWRPGTWTSVLLVVGLVFNLWLFSPPFWNEVGVDSKDLYAAATLAARGGNPYDVRQQVAEQDRLYNAPRNLRPSDGDYYHHATYGYPPLFTRLSELGIGLGEGGYYLVTLVLVVLTGVLGLEALLRALSWRGRLLPHIALLSSVALALAAFVGNPSTILLLGFGGALLLLVRGRPLAAGLALSLVMLKLPVGLPVAAAFVAGAPRGRTRVAGGLIVACAGWLGLDLLLTGTTAFRDWIAGLLGYGASLSTVEGRTLFSQSGLAGLPGLLVDRVSLPLAVGAAVVPVAALLAWVWWRRRGVGWSDEPLLPLALLTASALMVSPYLHLNDLVLEALPLLVLAARPVSPLSRVALVAWAVLVPARLVTLTIASMLFRFGASGQERSAGIGIVLTGLVLLSLALGAARLRRAEAPL